MSTVPSVLHILNALWRRLSTLLSSGSTIHLGMIAAFLRCLSSAWKLLGRRWCGLSMRGNDRRQESPPPAGLPSGGDKGHEIQKWTAAEDCRSQRDIPYSLIDDGSNISLHDVAASAYPFSGSSIRNPARSSENLRISGEAHDRNIHSSRNGSRVSVGGSAGYASSSRSSTDEPPSIAVNEAEGPSDQGYLGADQLTPARGSPKRKPTPLPEIETDIPGDHSTSVEVHTPIRREESPPPQWLECGHIRPVMPNTTQRYGKRPTIDKYSPPIMINPLTTSFIESRTPIEWTLCNHPEGARYFHHKQRKIFSDADLFDRRIFARAMEDISAIEKLVSRLGTSVPKNRHLIIDLNYSDETSAVDGIQTIYYFVDHDTRSVFFLDFFESSTLDAWYEASGCQSMKHLGYEIEAQYWYFVNLFPDSIQLSEGLISELRDMAHHFIGDMVTAPQSIAPFTLENLDKIAKWTRSLEKNLGKKRVSVGSMSLLSRLLYSFVHARFIHFHGEAHARLERDNSVYTTDRPKETLLIAVASMFLFWAPYVHLRALQKMWVDNVMHKAVWEDAIKKLNEEWQEFILFGTVLLNANVGFLSIQSVDVQSTNSGASQSPAQIASYISMAASAGSILLGLLLIRQNRSKVRESAEDVQNYLNGKNHPLLGLETLAIIHSLPYALLIWSMVAFLAAFCLHCFLTTDLTTRAVVGSLCAAIATLVFWSVWNAWETHPEAVPEATRFKEDFAKLMDRMHIPSLRRRIPNIQIRRPTYLSRNRRSSETAAGTLDHELEPSRV